MSLVPAIPVPREIIYPESDGQPMADNSKQARWMVILFGNLAALFSTAKDVLVGMNMFWYPVEGEPDIRLAPDVFVVFGRPKGDRGSYKQWEENGIPMTVAFEILSPSNKYWEMADKLAFYDEHGVEEYYVYDPDENTLSVYNRGQMTLRLVRHQGEYTSKRLGIRFDLRGPEMVVHYPDGRRFLPFEELDAQRAAAEERADLARRQLVRLAELSRKARLQQASPEELQELQRLEQEAAPSP